MKLFLPKCLGITLLCCLYSIFLSAQTGPAGVNSGSVLWLDASDVNAGAAAPTVGSTVSSWKDKSGSNHNATSTGANTAIYTSGGANSTPVIRFNRTSATSGTGFTVSGLDIRATTSPAITVFAVYRQGTNDGNNQAVWGNDNGSLQRFFNSKWSTGTTDGSLSTGGTAAVVAGASTVGETRLVTGVYAAGANASGVYLNGKKLSSFTDVTAASSGQSVFKIGSDGDDNYFNGDVSEIIVYNRKLTDCEIETVNRYLADKYATDFINIGANYTLGVPINNDINGVGKPVSACSGTYTIATASSDIVMITNPSSTSTSGVVLTFANDRKGYASSSETPPAYSSRLTQRWRADLNGTIGTVDICFNLQNLGIDVSNSGNFALLIDKDGNFSDASVVSTGVSIFIDRVCISNVSITKGDYFTLAIRASTSDASSITSPNKGIFQKANFTAATVIDNQLQVKGNDTITNGRVYIDSNFVTNDVLGWTAGALPAGITGAYNATTGALSFTGKATAAQWQTIFRTVTFSTTSGNITDRSIRFVLGNVISYTVGSKPHYYEYVTTPMNWVDAKAAAAARTLYGLQGYLATSTSQIENDFLKARLSSDGWVGASCNLAQVNSVSGATQYSSQASLDGHYYWVTGPEAGLEISTGLINPVAVGSAYTNWNGAEPNNYQNTNEQFVQLYSTNAGKWNDLPLTSLLGYVVEYGGYASDAVINIEYSRIVRSAPAAPVITGITTDSNIGTDRITNDPTLSFAGTSPGSAKVTILREDLGVIGNVTANGSGAWTFNYTGTTLTDGTYNFTAVDTVASVESAMSVVFQVTIDRTAPAKPATPALPSGGSYINTQLPTFTGSAEPGSTVILYNSATARGTAVADSTGKWTITANANLAVGTRSITVTATDIAGNVSVSSDIFSVVIDLTAPAAPARPVLVGGTAGAISNRNPTITGSGAEANSTVLIIQDGVVVDSVTADAGGNYTYTFANALPDAVYSITAKDRDLAGNLGAASPALSITVDTTPPATLTAPVLTGGNNGIISNHKPTITGSGAEANSTVIIYKDGVAVDSVTANASGNYTYTFVTSLPDAVYSITVKDKDAVGNVSAMSPALSLTVDTTVPVRPAAPVLVGGNNGVININTPTITGIAEANSKVIIYRGGIAIDTVLADASGNYNYTFTPLADATYSITVKARDAAGNLSLMSLVLSMTVDTTTPSTPDAPLLVGGDNGVISDNNPTITGIAEANSTVIIYKDGIVLDSVTTDVTGEYTYTFAFLPDATYSITVKDKDAAGNVSGMSPALSITVDTTAPATPAAPVLVGGVNGLISDNTPTISGVAQANSAVLIYKDGIAVDVVTADASGNYTYTFTTLADGTYSITVKDRDAAGNVSGMSPALSITVDTTPPVTPAAPVLVGGNNGIISDNTPTIEGTADANSTVIIFKDGIAIDSVTADAGGDYTYTFDVLADATYSITIKDKDAAGNVSAASSALSITVDTTVPVTPAAPVLVGGVNGVISDHTPTISGTAEANSTVIIYQDGVAVDSVTADASGDYTYTFDVLVDAVYSITVKDKDAAGNVSASSPALSITVDTAPPVTPAAPILVGGVNGVISDNTPTITGVAEANSTVIIYKDGVAVDSVTADASGDYTYTFTTLADATYSITVKAKDAVGNVSASSPALSITVDTTAPATPAAPVLVGGINGVTADNTPTITGVAEANSTVIIYQDGIAVDSVTADASGDYTYTFDVLADAAYSITVKDKDAVDNVSASSPALSITVDTTVPVTPAAPVLVGGVNGVISDNTPTITGVAEANSTVIIYKDGVAVDSVSADASGDYTYTFTTLADATYSITVKDKDAVGNVSAMSPALSIIVDTTPPATPAAPVLVGGNNGVISDNTPTITGVAEANSTVIIYKGGVAVDSVTADASGNYTYTFTTLADGTYSITVKDKDAVGNVSASSPALSITVDTTVPTTPAAPVLVGGINGVTADNTPTIKGVAEANSTVIIYKGGAAVDSVTADASGNYTYTFTSLADATYSITVKDKDAAGNVSASSPALSITIDTAPPTTPAAPVLVGGINGVIADNTPTISGVAEANSTVIIYKGGIAVDSVTANASGNYTYTFTTLADGTYSITVKAKDAVGNVSAASSALSITVDTTAPTTPTAPVLVDGNNGVISDNTPTIEGIAEANSTVIIFKGGVAIDSVSANASGNYTYTFTTALPDGIYSIKVKDKDAVGNVSALSPALSLTVDTNAPATPAAPVLVGGINGVTADNTPTITGVAEANSTVIIYQGGVAIDSVIANASGNYTYTFTTLADATYSVTVKNKDAAANVSAMSPALSFRVDTTVPLTPAAPVLVGGINGVIADNTPTITGVAEANSKVIIYKGGVAVDSVTADAGGNYTYTFTTLADGTYSITVKDKDAVGNVSAMSPALSIIVDTTPPATPAAPVLVGGNNGVINNNKPTITGVAEANSTVIIYKGGVVLDSVTANATGAYTYTFATALADGTYSITVKDKDAAGNVSAFSPALSITIDTVVPATPTAPVLVGGNNGVTNDATPDIKGQAEANSTVTIYVDGVSAGTTAADASGNYTYTFTTDLTNGAHAITVTATDKAANVSAASPALNITVDNHAPATPPAPLLVGGNNNVTTDPTPDIKGSAEANSTVTIYSDGVVAGATIADANGDYTFTFPAQLMDGKHAITVTAKDAMGNTSAESPALNIVVDAHPPARPPAPVLVNIADSVTKDPTPDIKGKAEANSTVTIYSDQVAVGTTKADASGNYTFTFITDLTDGAHNITVTATDTANNVSPVSPALSLYIDTHAPGTPTAPVLVGGNDGLINDATPDIRGKAEPNSTANIYVDGVVAGTAPVDASGNYTFTFPAAISDGPHAITATATDAAGNTSENQSPALNIVIDTKPPSTPSTPILVDGIDGVIKTTKPTVTGTVEPNTTVTIYDGDVAVGTTTSDNTGKWTYTFDPGISNGAHVITVTATDAAGNTSAKSAELPVTVNAHVPAVPMPPRLPGVNGVTNTTTPTIAGQGEPGTLITVYTDGEKSGTALVDANGNWTYTYTTPLLESVHNINVTASEPDGANESGHSETVQLTIDLVGPTVKLSSNTTAGAVVNGTVSITVTFSEGVSGFSWDDVNVTNGKVSGFTQVSSGIYQVLISPTTNGRVTIEIPEDAGFDIIGNGNSASSLLAMDMKPAVGIDQVFPMPATDVIHVRLSGVDDEQAVVKMTNMAGQVILHQQNIIKEGILTVNVQRVPSGSYVLLVVLEKGSYNTTVVIAR
jgi:outer membrane usher protein FimD/PapC